MPRDARVHLEDMVEACNRISEYTAGLTFETFRADQKTVDAVIRNLEIIGEAAKRIPDEVQRRIAVEWKRIAGLRDVLIHEYFEISIEIVWDIVQTKVPELSAKVADHLRSDSS